MVMFKLNIDLVSIVNKKITINEYLTLFKIFLINNDKKEPFFTNSFIAYEQDYQSLIEKEFIMTSLFDASGYVLTDKGATFFKNDDSLFETFYNMFPKKVPNGLQGLRPVANQDINTKGAEKTKQLWKAITKNDISLQTKIIECLKKELTNKEVTGSLMYLPNIDTWLQNRTWEKWEDLPSSNNDKKGNILKL